MVAALLAALLLPAVAGTALVVSGRGGRPSRDRLVNGYALAVAVATAVLVVVTVVRRPVLDRPWIPSLGVRWHFAVDGISAPLLVLTAVLGVAVVLHARSHPPAVGSGATFHGCLLLVEFGALATFLTSDAVLFFVAFEVVLVPMWVLISRFGDAAHPAARRDASGRFVLYTVLGSTLMLVGILALVGAAGTADLSALAAGRGAGLTRTTQVVVAALLLTGLGIKVPLWPVHTWLPPAHTVAPTAGSVLLAAVLLKMGTYGIVRLVLAPLPDGFAAVSPVLAVAGVIGILWGGLACLVENDLKRLVAYSSVAHMGFVALGLASGTTTGVQAALFANVAHGIVSALLFFLVGGLKDRWGSADLRTARAALREVSPRLGFVMVVGFAATLGLPGLVGFWGEFLAMFAAWSPAADRPLGLFRACAVLAVLGTGLAAAYSLRVLRTVWAGERTDARARGRPRWRAGRPGRARRRRRRPGCPARPAAADHDRRRHRHHHPRERDPVSSSVVSVDAGVLLPVLAPAAGAAAVLVLDVVATRLRRSHYLLALVSVVVGVFGTLPGLGAVPGDARSTLCLPASPDRCFYAATAVGSGLQLAALLGALVTLLLAWPEERDAPEGRAAVTASLVLTATAGATAVAAARDLGTWLVALELATLPIVALVALRGARSAVSGAVALLTTSLVSFAMLALAAALWLAATGRAFFDADAALVAAADPGRRAVLVLAVVLALAGIGFKLSLVPFHAWTPEAYDGAPLSVATFLAGTSKVAALAALLVVVQAVTPLGAPVLSAVAGLAVLSMTLGNVMALRQDNVVRLLAWSTVAQAGWVVLPLAAVSTAAVRASAGYLLAYLVATLLAFAVVAALTGLRGPR